MPNVRTQSFCLSLDHIIWTKTPCQQLTKCLILDYPGLDVEFDSVNGEKATQGASEALFRHPVASIENLDGSIIKTDSKID